MANCIELSTTQGSSSGMTTLAVIDVGGSDGSSGKDGSSIVVTAPRDSTEFRVPAVPPIKPAQTNTDSQHLVSLSSLIMGETFFLHRIL